MNIPPRIHPYIHSTIFHKHQLLARKFYQSQKNRKVPEKSIENNIHYSDLKNINDIEINQPQVSYKDEILKW